MSKKEFTSNINNHYNSEIDQDKQLVKQSEKRIAIYNSELTKSTNPSQTVAIAKKLEVELQTLVDYYDGDLEEAKQKSPLFSKGLLKLAGIALALGGLTFGGQKITEQMVNLDSTTSTPTESVEQIQSVETESYDESGYVLEGVTLTDGPVEPGTVTHQIFGDIASLTGFEDQSGTRFSVYGNVAVSADGTPYEYNYEGDPVGLGWDNSAQYLGKKLSRKEADERFMASYKNYYVSSMGLNAFNLAYSYEQAAEPTMTTEELVESHANDIDYVNADDGVTDEDDGSGRGFLKREVAEGRMTKEEANYQAGIELFPVEAAQNVETEPKSVLEKSGIMMSPELQSSEIYKMFKDISPTSFFEDRYGNKSAEFGKLGINHDGTAYHTDTYEAVPISEAWDLYQQTK